MVDGKFLAEDSTAPPGQSIVVGLLERCLLWSDIVLQRYDSHCWQLISTFYVSVLTTATGKARSMCGSAKHTRNWSRYAIN